MKQHATQAAYTAAAERYERAYKAYSAILDAIPEADVSLLEAEFNAAEATWIAAAEATHFTPEYEEMNKAAAVKGTAEAELISWGRQAAYKARRLTQRERESLDILFSALATNWKVKAQVIELCMRLDPRS